MKYMLLPLLLSVAFLFSCEKEKMDGNVVSDPQLVSELHSKSIDTLVYKSSGYIIEVQLWRDFFPGGPVSKRRLLGVSVNFVNLDSLPVSPDLTIKNVYVIHTNELWITSLRDGSDPYTPAYKINKVNTNGPEWETGIYVDVIVAISNKELQATYYVIAKHQKIERLD